MPGKKLDRKQPFGEISNDSQGRKFEQNGVFFTAAGDEWVDPNEAARTALPDGDKPDPAVLPTVNDIDPDTGKKYTKAKITALTTARDAAAAQQEANPAPAGDATTSQVDAQLNG